MGCNAWNHSASCNCGWGGDTRSGTGETIVNLSSSLSNSFSTAQTKDAETYLTKCWWCGEEVYYHTNGYGDSVLFDSLGWPWEIHSCWKAYWREQSLTRFISKNTIFNDSNPDQQKRLILAGAIQKIKEEHHLATERIVAYKMGLFTDQFREIYSHLYVLGSNFEIQICVSKFNNNRAEKYPNAPNFDSRENLTTEITCTKCNKRIKQVKFQEHIKIHELEDLLINRHKNELKQIKRHLTTCPYCKQSVREDRLKKHITKVHNNIAS